MPTIIDELIVTLGLDGKKFENEALKTANTIKKVGDDALKISINLEVALKKQQTETTKRFQQTEQVGKQTYQAFNKLRLEVLALFSTLATGYGIQQFIKNVTATEANIGRLSKAIGNVSTRDLAAFEQASERMGGSADAAGQSMLGFSQAIERWRLFNEVPPFIGVLRQMRIDLADSKGKARDLMDIMKDIGTWASAHKGPEAQAALGAIGLDQGMINLLSSGKLDEEMEKVKRIGVTNEEDARRGQEFVETLHDFEQTLTRLGQILANDYLPEINKALTGMTEWTVANGEWLKADIEDKISKGITFIKEFLAAVGEVVKAVGGWKDALEIVFGLWALSKVAPIVTAIASITAAITGLKIETMALGALAMPPWLRGLAALGAVLGSTLLLSGDTPGGGDEQEKLPTQELDRRVEKYNKEHPDHPIESFSGMMSRMYHSTRRFLGMPSGANDDRLASVRDQLSERLGISGAAASGIVSSLDAESGIQGINEVNPAVPGSRGGFGWAQWTGPRRDEFDTYVARNRLDPSSDEANMGFLVQELTTKYPQVLAQLKRGGISAREAADIVARGYIVPPSDKIEGHVADAQRIQGLAPGGPRGELRRDLEGRFGHPASYDPALFNATRFPAAASSLSNDNSRNVANSNQTTIGEIKIQTSATDSDGIARGIAGSIRKYAYANNASYGLA